MRIITFGTFDLLHIGHINILERSKNFDNNSEKNELIVGISSDEFSFKKKNIYPVYNQEQRKKILESLRFVDKVFIEESFERKRKYILDAPKGVNGRNSDNTLIKKYLNWEPTTSLFQGMEITYKWIYDQMRSKS